MGRVDTVLKCNHLFENSRDREVPEMFHSSVAVFCMEVMKMIFCLGMIFNEVNGLGRYVGAKQQSV